MSRSSYLYFCARRENTRVRCCAESAAPPRKVSNAVVVVHQIAPHEHVPLHRLQTRVDARRFVVARFVFVVGFRRRVGFRRYSCVGSVLVLVAVRGPIASLHVDHARPPQTSSLPSPTRPRSSPRSSRATSAPRAGLGHAHAARVRKVGRGSCPIHPVPAPSPVSARASRRPRRAGGSTYSRRRRAAGQTCPPVVAAVAVSCGVFGRWRGGDGDGQSLGELTRRVGGRRSSEVASRTGETCRDAPCTRLSQTLTTSRHGSRSAIREATSRAVGRCGADSVGKSRARCSEDSLLRALDERQTQGVRAGRGARQVPEGPAAGCADPDRCGQQQGESSAGAKAERLKAMAEAEAAERRVRASPPSSRT